MKKFRIVLLLFWVILLFSVNLNTGYGADPDFPEWQVGNWWKFNVEISAQNTGVGYVGTQTITVVNDDVNVFQNGQDFNCYQIEMIGGGTIFGEFDGSGISGTWTVTENHYYTKSEFSWVNIYSTYEEIISFNSNSGISSISTVQDKNSYKSISNVSYNPPFEANKGFPLTVGKSWSATTTETVETLITINGNSESTTESEAYTKTFLVLRKQSITTSIGDTEVYVIKRTDPDGAYGETYYSPDVGTDVKMVEYDSTGTIQVSMELLSYEYTPRTSLLLFTAEILPILLVVSIIIISTILIIYFLKRKKTDNQSQNIVTSFAEYEKR